MQNNELITKARDDLSKAIKNYDKNTQQGSSEEFKQVANGFFQPEGHISAGIKIRGKIIHFTCCFDWTKLLIRGVIYDG
jgi:hypothetical protein